ncbi:MAG TPA: hypothetical protein VM911_13455 [Pyrinomonadaceae bacterium]|nr:hypothetical protein [Pyrinomonadaceae bacterium]
MSMPGFTATNSLAQTEGNYYGGRSLSIEGDDMVDPQFLGFIKEAFESIGSALSSAVMAGADALSNALSNLRDKGGPGGRPFVCGQWVTTVLACSGKSPAYSQAEMLARCISTNPAQMAVCAVASAGLYPLVQQACAQGSDTGQLLGRVCKG